jgi:hypothetical protein
MQKRAETLKCPRWSADYLSASTRIASGPALKALERVASSTAAQRSLKLAGAKAAECTADSIQTKIPVTATKMARTAILRISFPPLHSVPLEAQRGS